MKLKKLLLTTCLLGMFLTSTSYAGFMDWFSWLWGGDTTEQTTELPVADDSVPDTDSAKDMIDTPDTPDAPPAVDDDSSVPMVDDDTSAPVVDDDTSAPVVDDDTSAPVVDDDTSAPVVDDTPAPTVDDTSAPLIDDDTSAPMVDDAPAPTVDDTSAPLVDDDSSAPMVDDSAPEDIRVEGKPAEIIAEPVDQDAPLIEDTPDAVDLVPDDMGDNVE